MLHFIFVKCQCAFGANQADNLVNLRQEFLSVPVLITEIFCAVSRAINLARLLAIRILACCHCLCNDYFACFTASSNSIETILVTPFSSIVTPKIVSAWRMVGFLCVITINCV